MKLAVVGITGMVGQEMVTVLEEMNFQIDEFIPVASERSIGKKIEYAVSAFFDQQGKDNPTRNFGWDYVLVDNDKIVNAWCMPGGKIAVYTGLLKITKNIDALSIVMGPEA